MCGAREGLSCRRCTKCLKTKFQVCPSAVSCEGPQSAQHDTGTGKAPVVSLTHRYDLSLGAHGKASLLPPQSALTAGSLSGSVLPQRTDQSRVNQQTTSVTPPRVSTQGHWHPGLHTRTLAPGSPHRDTGKGAASQSLCLSLSQNFTSMLWVSSLTQFDSLLGIKPHSV